MTIVVLTDRGDGNKVMCVRSHPGTSIPQSIASAAGQKAGRLLEVRLLDNGEIRLRPVGAIVPVAASDITKVVVDEPKRQKW